MMFWNRVELYNGYSLKEFSELKSSLANAGIRYDYKMINNRHRAVLGSFGQASKFSVHYYLYVHQKDYDNAMFLTSNRNR